MHRVTLKGQSQMETKAAYFGGGRLCTLVTPSSLISHPSSSSPSFPIFPSPYNFPIYTSLPLDHRLLIAVHHRLLHHRLVCGEALDVVTLCQPARPPPSAPQFCRTSRDFFAINLRLRRSRVSSLGCSSFQSWCRHAGLWPIPPIPLSHFFPLGALWTACPGRVLTW